MADLCESATDHSPRYGLLQMNIFKRPPSERPEILYRIAYFEEVRDQLARRLFKHHTSDYVELYSLLINLWKELSSQQFGESKALNTIHKGIVDKYLKAYIRSSDSVRDFTEFRASGAPLPQLGFGLREFISTENNEPVGFRTPEASLDFLRDQYLFVSAGLFLMFMKESKLRFWFATPHQSELEIILERARDESAD